MEKLWTTNEVARFLGVTDIDVEELVRQGKLTGYRLGGQFLRFRPDQVHALKGQILFRPTKLSTATQQPDKRAAQIKDMLYFYDFYLLSAVILAGIVIYLVAAS